MSQPGVAILGTTFQEHSAVDSAAVLRIESTTWNRDSHELFDYESRHVFGRKYLLRKPAKVFRSSLDVSVVIDGNELPQNADYLLSVKAREGKFYIYPADRNVCGPAANIQPRKLWLIIKHLQRSSFPLNEGDVIKLGRFKLRVKQVVTESEGATPVDFKLDDVEVPATELSVEDAPQMQCRICLLEGGEAHDPLVRACQCKGSIMYVHLDCLRHWVNGRLNLADDPSRSCCFVKQIQCELCKSTFPSFVTARGVKLPVVKVPNVQPPFIVLENMVGPTNRGVHLCSMSVKKECKLGRGHESDVRIADVSISRFHAMIKYIDGSFFLEDHGSKFGTLVALRKPTMVERVEKLSVQVGRTVMKFSMEENVAVGNMVDCQDITDQSDNPAAAETQNYSDGRSSVQGHAGDAVGGGGDSSMEGVSVNGLTQTQMNQLPAERYRGFGLPPATNHQANNPPPTTNNMYHFIDGSAIRGTAPPPPSANDFPGLLQRPSGGAGPETAPERAQMLSAAAARLVPFGMNINQLFYNTAAYSPRMFEGGGGAGAANDPSATNTENAQQDSRLEGWVPATAGGAGVVAEAVGGGSLYYRLPQQQQQQQQESPQLYSVNNQPPELEGLGGGDESMTSRVAPGAGAGSPPPSAGA